MHSCENVLKIAVWIEGKIHPFPKERIPMLYKTQGKKHPVELKGKFPTVLALTLCYRFLRFSCVMDFCVPNTPLVISRVFPFLCFTTTHLLHSYVFSYSRVFDSCVPNRP